MCGAVLLAFVVAVGATTIELVSREDYTFLFGLPAESRPIFLLPLIAILLTVLMAAGVGVGWRRWGWLRRINRALLALVAAVCIGALASLNMVLSLLG